MKYFISQPMNGLTDEQIKQTRSELEDYFRANDSEAEFIDSFLDDVPQGASPLWLLGESIKLLSFADIAVFAYGFESARGCKLEFECANKYGIRCLIQNSDGSFK